MSKKQTNSVIFIATLGVYIGLLMAGAAKNVNAQSEDVSNSPGSERVLNKKPFWDFAETLRTEIEANSIDLNSPFLVELKGTLNKDGFLEPETSRFIRIERDLKLARLASSAIESVNSSGFFAYLSDIDAKEIGFLISQNEADVDIILDFETITSTRARSLQITLNTLIDTVKQRNSLEDATEAQKDDLVLLKAMKITAHDKTVKIGLSMPKAEFHALVIKYVQR
ncbi:MAG: hypothetical protein KF855_04985 [Acidobacteria bacterium]|nr:hypothetical protein [Acidobacteriota bacterium]